MKNDSPWLHQLQLTRLTDTLKDDIKADVAIVGAGIAGIMTAYFTLKQTDRKVTVIEGYKVAHGSTGHNAGQIVSEFEREFYDIAEEYGLEQAADAERLMRSGWILLEEIYADASLHTPMSSFMGYSGFANMSRVLEELRNNTLRAEVGIATEPIYIAEDAPGLSDIPHVYKDFYSVVPRENITALMESLDDQYIAAVPGRIGCINSALLVEEIVGYLLNKYADRFTLLEHTPVRHVDLFGSEAILHAHDHAIFAKRVILCTNGFQKFTIDNKAGQDIDTEFHHTVQGAVAYMAGYLEPLDKPPTALSYFDAELNKKGHAKDVYHEEPYFYVTRRPYELEKDEHHNLVCIGGPEVLISDTTQYVPDSASPEEAIEKIDKFYHQTHKHAVHKHDEYRFKWHGLLCYTPNGIRLIGSEPQNPVLMYNLGCNGVGILPSIYGGKRIGDLLSGVILPPSIFDPKDHRVSDSSE